MFRLIYVVLFSAIACQGWSSTERLATNSGFDAQIIHGELPNGLDYYIRENHYPPQKASLRLVVKVGSVHESETERGVAHFLEHLNFRGSKHFADGEIVRYLESIGAWFGPDTNATTSLESTLYILDVPIHQEGAIDQSLLVLRDFAGNALLADEIIEKERHVVLDEAHQTLSSPEYRLLEKSLQFFLPELPLGHSLPIGTKEVISEVDAETLRACYDRWYRSDRMAVVAVGDFKAEEVQARIERLFSDILPSEDFPLEAAWGEISDEDPQILIHFDEDLPSSRIELYSFFPTPEQETDPKEFLKEQILSGLVITCLQNRFTQFYEQGLVLGVSASEGGFILNDLSACHSASTLLSDSVEEGMRSFGQFLQSLKAVEFSPDEFETALDAIREEIRDQTENLEYTTHSDFVDKYISHFLEGELLISPEWAMQECDAIARAITLEECNEYVSTMHFGKGGHILFATGDHDIYERVSADLLTEIFQSEDETQTHDVPGGKNSFSYRDPDQPGTIAEIKDRGSVLEWTLGNQMQVVLKQTDLEHDRVVLYLRSNKGLSDVPEADYNSAQLLISYLRHSGLNHLRLSEFDSYLNRLGITCDIHISFNHTTIALTSPRQHLETAFQIVHDLFHPLSFDRSKWPLIVNLHKEVQKQMQTAPFGKFYLESTKINTQDHYLFQPLDFDALNPETAESLAPYFFGTPRDFTAILVGDFDENETNLLTKRYLASLPVPNPTPAPRLAFSSFFPTEQIEREIAAGKQTYEQVEITIPFEAKEISSNTLSAAFKLMNQRLLARLRWQAGGTYGAEAYIVRPFYPSFDAATLKISFSCQHSERSSLIQAVFEEIERWKTEPCSQEELETLKKLLLEELQTEKLSNTYWLWRISHHLQWGIPLEAISDGEAEIHLDKEEIRSLLQQLFQQPYYSILTHIPE